MKEQKTIRKTLKKLGVESYLRGYAYLLVAIDEQIRKVLQVLKDKGAITDFNSDISKGKQKKYKIRIM